MLTIEEEVGEGQVIRREEAVILCYNDIIGEWEIVENGNAGPMANAVDTILSLVGL